MLKEKIGLFLGEKRIGFVGASRNWAKFSNKVYQQLKESGHEVHLVHHEAEAIDGGKCVPSISRLPSDVNALMIIARPDVAIKVLKDIPETGINHIWVFYGPVKKPEVEAEAERLRSRGANIIFGLCPFMFLEPVKSVHAFHRFIVRLVGKYPK